jgi:LPS export ABC transporter protein LptC
MPRRNARALHITLVAAVVLGACEKDAVIPVASADQEAMNADNIVVGLTHNMTNNGLRRALLFADTAYVYEDSASMDLRNVKLTLFDDLGRKTADLRSRRGKLNTVTRAMVATGDVDLTTVESGRRIRTQELNYDPQADRVWSNKPTEMREGGTVLNGTGFTADSRMRNVQVTGATGRGLRLRL